MSLRHYDELRNMGLNIAYYRKKKNISQIQLAEMINISRTHISRIETAECAPSLEVILDICDAIEIQPSKLFDCKE